MASPDVAQRSHTTAALGDMFGRGLIFAAVLALQSVAMIVVTPLTVRSLSKIEFGRLVTVFTLIQLLVMVFGFGLGTAIQRLHSEDDPSGKRTRGLLGFSLLLALSATIAVDLTGPLWAGTLDLGHYGHALRLGVWAAGMSAMVMLIASLFRSQDRLGAFTALMMPFSVGSQLVGFGCIFWFRPTASSYLAGMCIGELAALALGLVLSRPRLLAFGNRSIVWSALYLTLPLVPNGIAYQTLNLGDRIVVQHKLGSFAVGRYQIAYNAAALVILALTLLNQAWLPKVFSIKDTTLRKVLLAELRDEVYLLLVPLVIGMSMVAPIVLRILAPASYHTGDLLLVVSLVAISAVPYAAFQSNTRTLTVFGRTRSLIWAAPVAAVVNIVLNIALVPVWGLDASATATLVGYAILAWITGFYSRRAARLSSTGAPVWIALTAAGAVSLASTFFPATALFVGLRLAMAVICAAWATRDVAVLVKGTKQPRRSRASRDKEVVVGH